MIYKGKIKLNGKEYPVEIIGGTRYIDGKTVDEFMKTLDIFTVWDLSQVGQQALIDEKRGTKPRKYQKMMDIFHLRKSN